MKRAAYIQVYVDVSGPTPQMIVDTCGGLRSGASARLRH
jgi:hypothetical protein